VWVIVGKSGWYCWPLRLDNALLRDVLCVIVVARCCRHDRLYRPRFLPSACTTRSYGALNTNLVHILSSSSQTYTETTLPYNVIVTVCKEDKDLALSRLTVDMCYNLHVNTTKTCIKIRVEHYREYRQYVSTRMMKIRHFQLRIDYKLYLMCKTGESTDDLMLFTFFITLYFWQISIGCIVVSQIKMLSYFQAQGKRHLLMGCN